jgi:hypothetical protein
MAPRGPPFPLLKWQQPAREKKGKTMIKSAPFAAELATQIVLAASIGLAVSLALAGLVLLLAA